MRSIQPHCEEQSLFPPSGRDGLGVTCWRQLLLFSCRRGARWSLREVGGNGDGWTGWEEVEDSGCGSRSFFFIKEAYPRAQRLLHHGVNKGA